MSHPRAPKATGFFAPYLVIRFIPAVYLTVPLPVHATTRQLVARAERVMERSGRRYSICLVISPVRCLYLKPDGSSSWANMIPFGGIRVPLRRVNWRALSRAGRA